MVPNLNVAIGHTAGSGKDTLAALIVQRNKHYRRALADAGKEELGCALLNLERRNGARLSGLTFVDAQKHRPEMRLLMQAYMDGKRELVNGKYWINQLLGYMEEYRAGELRAAPLDPEYAVEHAGVVVPDVRYFNEVAEFLTRGFLCLDLGRPDAPPLPGGLSKHRGETQLSPADFPYLIANDGTPEEMLAVYDRVAAHWGVVGRRPRREDWPLVFARSEESRARAEEHVAAQKWDTTAIERQPFVLTSGPIV
jgi:hypothetical protein